MTYPPRGVVASFCAAADLYGITKRAEVAPGSIISNTGKNPGQISALIDHTPGHCLGLDPVQIRPRSGALFLCASVLRFKEPFRHPDSPTIPGGIDPPLCVALGGSQAKEKAQRSAGPHHSFCGCC